MNSHEYAEKLKEAAAVLLDRPAFDTGRPQVTEIFWYWDKKDFLAAAKAIGSGTKEVRGTDFNFWIPSPENIKLGIQIARDKVCVKVQDEKWECQPILTQAEVDSLGTEEKDVLANAPF